MHSEGNVSLLHFIVTVIVFGVVDGSTCITPQYISFGDTDVVECSFKEHFYGIYWYSSTDSPRSEPFIAFEDFKKSGNGYVSGNYDVLLNGTLIIRNVSLNDDHFFRAILLISQEDDPIVYDIRVYVVVTSNQPYPYIDICNMEPYCFASVNKISKLTCEVAMTKPATNLTWTVGKDFREVPSKTEVSSENMLFSSVTTVMLDDLDMNGTVELLQCAAIGHLDIISVRESKIFLEDTGKVHPYEQSIAYHTQIRSMLLLACTGENKNFVLWRKKSTKERWQTIAIAYLLKDVYSRVHDDQYRLDKNGSLELLSVSVKDEGSYMCVISDDYGEKVQVFELFVYVPPDPPFATVQGCQNVKRCVLNVTAKGNLTCSVQGVRPVVQLKWLPFPEDNSRFISLINHKEVITQNGDTYDVSLTSTFIREDATQKRLAVECRVSKWEKSMVLLDRTVELQFIDTEIYGKTPPESTPWIIVVLVAVVVMVVVFILTIVYFFFWGKRVIRKGNLETATQMSNIEEQNKSDTKSVECERLLSGETPPNTVAESRNNHHKEEEDTDITRSGSNEGTVALSTADAADERKDFEEQLKSGYRGKCKVAPVQYLNLDKVCVNDFFVQRRFSFLNRESVTSELKLSTELTSHHDIFENGFSKSSRLILTGDRGSGKSTVSLQMAYEWCEGKDFTWITKYDMFILLNVADFVSGKTFFQSVKNLLAVDSEITVEEIERMLGGYSNGLIILHGYDKLNNVASEMVQVINHIIEGNLFGNFHVILTTTPQCIPKNIDYLASRFHLLDFEDRERSEYMNKKIVSKFADSDNQVIEQAIDSIKKNPFLNELLMNPLVFAWYMYIRDDDNNLFTSATAFIQKVIKVFQHIQARNEENFSLFQASDEKLAKFTFDHLSSYHFAQYWCVNELISEISKEAFDRYMEMGILTTEEVVEKSLAGSTHPGNVRFCNKVLFEFYAASYVKVASELRIEGKPEIESRKSAEEIANKVDFGNAPNVACFMCGLHNKITPKIVEKLCKVAKEKTLAMQCFLEIVRNKAPPRIQTDVIEKLFADDTLTLFKKGDSKLHQYCTLLVEEIASAYQMGLTRLSIQECLEPDKCTGDMMLLKNGLEIPVLQQLTRLHIRIPGQIVKTTQKIYQYASKCPKLGELVFESCLLLENYPPKELFLRKIAVEWSFSSVKLQMNYATRGWRECFSLTDKLSSTFPSPEKIKENVEAFRKRYRIEEDLEYFVTSFQNQT